ncbi:SIS domain-containing protein [Acidianus sulfidivorans JP7]|uniref:SIS domain-containing protein n=1 Tax=Acidianus sulfidivorans TaxID=312539 RepID=UPI0014436A48|nr:SIS domain-containing protein [Acidianus sulfidivorans]AWR96611.2 SIS domain-containing protein [Acidianus sulfidivorans JP7]
MNVIEEIEKELSETYKISTDLNLDSAFVTGAGDSYAASLVIEGKTKGRFKAIDPYDALDYDNLNKPLIIVSVSGKPKSNILLAKKFKGKTKIIVITANKNSLLANLADVTVELPYKSNNPLPGTLSFLMSISALYSIANEEEDKGEDKEIFLQNPFFIGKAENYGVAYFSYLKMAEIFGFKSNYERLEQFCHSPIFSSRKSQIIILSSNDKREEQLKSLINYTDVFKTRCEGAFCNTRTILKSIIYTMRKINWDKIYFLEDKNILSISSEIIY